MADTDVDEDVGNDFLAAAAAACAEIDCDGSDLGPPTQGSGSKWFAEWSSREPALLRAGLLRRVGGGKVYIARRYWEELRLHAIRPTEHPLPHFAPPEVEGGASATRLAPTRAAKPFVPPRHTANAPARGGFSALQPPRRSAPGSGLRPAAAGGHRRGLTALQPAHCPGAAATEPAASPPPQPAAGEGGASPTSWAASPPCADNAASPAPHRRATARADEAAAAGDDDGDDGRGGGGGGGGGGRYGDAPPADEATSPTRTSSHSDEPADAVGKGGAAEAGDAGVHGVHAGVDGASPPPASAPVPEGGSGTHASAAAWNSRACARGALVDVAIDGDVRRGFVQHRAAPRQSSRMTGVRLEVAWQDGGGTVTLVCHDAVDARGATVATSDGKRADVQLLEPPIAQVEQWRRGEGGGYEGRAAGGGGHVWSLNAADVESHFQQIGETEWLRRLTDTFARPPLGRAVEPAARGDEGFPAHAAGEDDAAQEGGAAHDGVGDASQDSTCELAAAGGWKFEQEAPSPVFGSWAKRLVMSPPRRCATPAANLFDAYRAPCDGAAPRPGGVVDVPSAPAAGPSPSAAPAEGSADATALAAQRGAADVTALPPNSCVAGAAAMALAAAGFTQASRTVLAAANDVLAQSGDRLAFVANLLRRKGLRSRKFLASCALRADPRLVTLLQLAGSPGVVASHAVAAFDGMLYDAAWASPRPLNRSNLSSALGCRYARVSRGYVVMPPAVAGKRAAGGTGGPPAKAVRYP